MKPCWSRFIQGHESSIIGPVGNLDLADISREILGQLLIAGLRHRVMGRLERNRVQAFRCHFVDPIDDGVVDVGLFIWQANILHEILVLFFRSEILSQLHFVCIRLVDGAVVFDIPIFEAFTGFIFPVLMEVSVLNQACAIFLHLLQHLDQLKRLG